MRNDGMTLEDEVFDLVQRLLSEKRLPYQTDLCRFYRRKSYYSPDRKANVDFENVLEIFVRDNVHDLNAQPTHVIFFECKDHLRNVEVARVDEVVGRLKAAYGFSMKGYIVTRRGFSSGAFETARSNGIGLLKIMDRKNIQFFLYRLAPDATNAANRWRDRFPERAMRALFDENYKSEGERYYGADGNYLFGALDDMLAHSAKTTASTSAQKI